MTCTRLANEKRLEILKSSNKSDQFIYKNMNKNKGHANR